jgi:hypothetical protein
MNQNSLQHAWAWLSGKKTYIISLVSVIYTWGVTQNVWPHSPLFDVALAAAGASALRHGISTSQDDSVPAPAASASPATVSKVAILIFALGLSGLLIGCAHLQPGSDPLVVRVEQGESGATSTFDFVLHEDNANRGFWITNAPAFHNFCEWLRTPTPYTGPEAPNGTIVARCIAMQLRVDDLKQSYKASKTAGNSNVLFSAFAVMDTAMGQAGAWQTIIKTPIHP